jgi:hypothetical protein
MSDEKKVEKKGGFLSKVGGLFATTVEDEPEVKEEVQNTPQTTTAFKYTNTTQNTGAPQMNGMFDEKFYAHLTKVIEKNNLDGIDYYEFSKSKKNLDSAPGFTEQMKYQSAFGVLAASTDLTKQRLLETADHYIQVLDKEEKDFEGSKNAEIESQVTSRTNSAVEKEKMIASKMEEITKIQTDITQLRIEIGTLQSEAQNSQIKIESTAKNFKYTIDSVRSQILADKTNIQNFIQ